MLGEQNIPNEVMQADFANPFINGRGFIYLRIWKMSFTFVSIYKSSR